MSFDAFVWAWRAPVEKAEHLLVLLALADVANDAGMVRAGAPYLAKKCRREERAVRRSLAALRDLGVIVVEEREGKVPLITLAIPDEFTVRKNKDQEHEAGRRGRPRKPLPTVEKTLPHGGGKPPTTASDEPLSEPKDEPRDIILSTPDPFEAWWTVYPRKIAKVEARKAWGQMTAPIATLTLAELMVRTRLFAEAMVNKDPEHVPHGATWLRGERWNDELSPHRSQTDGQFAGRTGPTDRAAERAERIVGPMLAGAQEALDRGGRRRWRL